MNHSNSVLVLKQIMITDKQRELLRQESTITGTPVSALIRGFITEHFRSRGML